jgi:hypothetical protein
MRLAVWSRRGNKLKKYGMIKLMPLILNSGRRRLRRRRNL